jgi:hypothetical protein
MKGAPFFSLVGGGGGGGKFFQVVVGLESGLSSVHFPLGQWTVDFPCKFLRGREGEGGSKQLGNS